MAAKYYWIKERHNPQFKKPYYVALGNIPLKEAKAHEKSLHGYNIVSRWLSKESYDAELARLRAEGYSVR